MPTEVLIEKMCSQNTLDILYECLEAAATPERTKRRFAKLPFKIGCKTGTAEIQAKFIASSDEDIRNNNRGITHDMGYHLGSVVCMMPLEKPKYTVMVAVLRQKGPWHERIESHNGLYVRPPENMPPRFGIDVAGPAASQIMLYLYNNDIELHPEVEEAPSPYPPMNIKGGHSSSVQMVSDELAPFVRDDNRGAAWSTTNIDVGGNVTISGMRVESGVIPDVRNMGLCDALYLLEDMGMAVTHEGVGAVLEQSIEPGTTIEECGGVIHLTLGIKKDSQE
jgi:cell division protein FtsI (penicillin-binding protein 3)